jgi:tetratricopeptide (TPR) repeat protein
MGDYRAGLEYAEREFELVEKLQSRERKAWACFIAGMCSFSGGDSQRAEREFREGLAIAEFIGERRAGSLLKGNLAIVLADKANGLSADDMRRLPLFEEALQIAEENFRESESLGLLYSRFEGHRCLAEVRFLRGELDEAERLCAAAAEFVAPTDSRVCRLWLGPLYVRVLLAIERREIEQGNTDIAAARRRLATELVENYQELVTQCESPRFTREAEKLVTLVRSEPFLNADGANA